MSDELTPTPDTPAESARTFTPDDVERIVKERLERERKKFADYEDAKAKAAEYDRIKADQMSEIEKANQKAADLEAALQAKDAELAAKTRAEIAAAAALEVAKELGVSPDAALKWAGKLDGDDADAMKQSARDLFVAFARSDAAPPPAADDALTEDDPFMAGFERARA